MTLLSIQTFDKPFVLLQNKVASPVPAENLIQAGFLATKRNNRWVLYYAYELLDNNELYYHPDFSFSVRSASSSEDLIIIADYLYEADGKAVLPIFPLAHLDDLSQTRLRTLLTVNDIAKWQGIIEKEEAHVEDIVTSQEQFSEFFDYILTDVSFTSPEEEAGSVTLELHVDVEETESDKISKDTYIEDYIHYRVIKELEGRVEDHYFPYNANGFLAAMTKYTALIESFSFEKQV